MTRIFLVFVSLFIICSTSEEESGGNENCKICGYDGEDVKYRVVNGDAIDPVKYPWLISIAKREDHEKFCTGALISSQYILTAAHCMEDHDKSKSDCKDDFCVRKAEDLEIGTWDEKSADTPTDEMKVGEVFPHSSFDGHSEDGVLMHDIALLKLKEKVTCDNAHGPICLMEKNHTGDAGDKLTMAGWGYSTTKGKDKKGDERKLKKGVIKQLPSEKCTESKKKSSASETIICGGVSSKQEQIPCQGDSGSSIFREVSGVYYSIGVGSAIIRDHDKKPCSLDGKVKFTKTSRHLEWIKEHVKELPKGKKED